MSIADDYTYIKIETENRILIWQPSIFGNQK